VSYTKL
jgi:phenylalanyl-tRNA synthetase beta chain